MSEKIIRWNPKKGRMDVSASVDLLELSGTLDMKGNKVKNQQDPADPKDGANKDYVDSSGGGGGDNLGNHIATEILDMNGYAIDSAGTISASQVSLSGIYFHDNTSSLIIGGQDTVVNYGLPVTIQTKSLSGTGYDSGDLYLVTGGGADTGDIYVKTGNSDVGGERSGNITIQSGTAIGGGPYRGAVTIDARFIYLKPAVSGLPTVGQVWTAEDTNGGGKWAAPAVESAHVYSDMYVNPSPAAVDWNNGISQELSLTGNLTPLFYNPIAGRTYALKLVHTVGGSKTITWPTNVRWSGAEPTLSILTDKIDIISFFFDGTDYFASYNLGY